MTRVILVTSGKGGVGKTTVTANLGRALAALGRRVVLVEGDIGLNNLDVALGVEDRILFDAGDVAVGKATVSQALVPIEDELSLFPATTGASNLVTSDVFLDVIKELKRTFDYVLIDSPAGIEENFHRAAIGAEEAILVTTPHLSAVRDGVKTAKLLSSYGIRDVRLLVNRVRGELVADKSMLSPKEIESATKLPLCGVLPEDDGINLTSLVDVGDKRSASAYSYGLIAGLIDGGERRIYDCTATYAGLFGKIKRWLNV